MWDWAAAPPHGGRVHPTGHERTAHLTPRRAQDYKEAVQMFMDYAQKHKDVIDRFGRFPHRNEALGRETTEEERKHLEEHGGF